MRARIFSGGFPHLFKTSRDLCLTVARTNLRKYMYWKKEFSFTNDLSVAVELNVMIIFFCVRASYRPGGKCLEIQNCVNSAPIVIILVSSTKWKIRENSLWCMVELFQSF